MDTPHDQTDLSLEQLEALVSTKKRALTEQKLVRVLQAETPGDSQDELGQELHPSRSPESWRGAQGHDRHFQSGKLVPLDASLTGETHAPAQGREIKRFTWRDRALLVGEILALAGFLVILGASFRRVRDLNTEYQQTQQTRVSDQVGLALQSPTSPSMDPTDVSPVLTLTVTPTQPRPTLAPTEPPTPPSALVAPTLAGTQESDMAEVPTVTLTPTPEPTVMLTVPTATTVAPTNTPATPSLPGERPEASPTADDSSSGGIDPATLVGTPTTAATTAPGVPLRIVIPSIEVDAPVVQGDAWEDLKLGVGHRIASAMPGESSNVVMSAHNDIYGEIFRQLHKVEIGDLVIVHTEQSIFRYEVVSNEIVSPSRVDLMDPTDTAILTLISCYPYMLDTHRVVVRASLVP